MRRCWVRSAVRLAVAAASAALGVLGEAWGCMALLALGVTCLVLTPRRCDPNPRERLAGPYFDWVLCVLLFATFAVLLMPWSSLPPVVGVVVLLSPVLGTQVLLIKSTVCRVLTPAR